jgi:folate-binding protein YgfZ
MTLASIWSWPEGEAPRLLRQPVQLLALRGPDTLRFLHGQSSQDLALARPGAWLSTCCITPTARMRAVAEVLVEENGALLVIRAGDGAAVRQAFDRVLFPADAVELGPLLEGVWLEPVGTQATEAKEVTAAGPTGGGWRSEPGGGWWLGAALVQPAGAPLPAALAALPALDPWQAEFRRLRLGLPAAPGEINDDTNPFELGLAGRVSLGKGCYVGQETLARLATYDGVKRQLRRWHVPVAAAAAHGLAAPEPGTPLRSAAGERAGVVSSCLALPEGAGWVGLALVRRAALAEIQLWSGDGQDGAGDACAPSGWRFELSLPELFEEPPVGAGGQGAAAGAARLA